MTFELPLKRRYATQLPSLDGVPALKHRAKFISTLSVEKRSTMLVGHLAVALTAKKIEPKISLGTWTLAAFLADLVAFPLLIAGVEHFDPVPGAQLNRTIGRDIVYSHSLLMNVVWAALFAGAYFLRRRYSRGAWLLFVVVVSHWILDVISHHPDMQLGPGFSQVYGFRLWSSLPATLIVEGGFWLVALVLYTRATRPPKFAGRYAFWIGAALITLVWYGNLHAGMDPNPVKAGVGGLILFSLMVAWAYWINRLRPMKA
ncbi:MAG TPA: hypothetical protein VGW76_02415 [Pyrinomonadaceae bacterium]|nr:hypothetical protein [Pyrinomonadaceae bacterium]